MMNKRRLAALAAALLLAVTAMAGCRKTNDYSASGATLTLIGENGEALEVIRPIDEEESSSESAEPEEESDSSESSSSSEE